MENQHREIKGYRELTANEIATMNEVKMKGAELGELVEKLKANKDLDQRWVSIGATNLQHGLMDLTRAIAKPTFFVFALLLLAGCVTPVKETSGKYIKAVQAANRDEWGTNQSFGRLQRCDGPKEEPWLFYRENEFTGCVFLTKAEQDEWAHGYSRGAGPEIAGAVIMGGAIGAGAAVSGVNAAAGATANATNTAIQTVGGKHRR